MSNDLNRFMAEKVMGWSLTVHDYYLNPDGEGNDRYMWMKPGHENFWNPTTDMNQALMCSEKWMDGDGSRTMEILSRWMVIIDDDDIDGSISVESESLPLAICQAIREAIDE